MRTRHRDAIAPGGPFLNACAAALVWAALLRRLRARRAAPGDSTHAVSCRILGATGLIITLSIPPVYRLVDRCTGVPNSARLLADGVGIGNAWYFYPLLPRVVGPAAGDLVPRRGPLDSAPLAIGTVAALCVCFAWARRDGAIADSVPEDFAARYGNHPAVLAYSLVFSGYGTASLARSFWFSRRVNQRLAHRPGVPARWRLHSRLQTAGWAVACLYVLHDGVQAVLRYVGIPYPARQAQLAAALLRAVGCALLLNKMLPDLPGWWTDYRTYRALHPLWRDLHRADPRWVLDALFRPRWAPWDDRLAIDQVALRLERRMTEIRDGLRALADSCDARVAADAATACRRAGLDEDAAHPIIAATTIAAAIHARKTRERPARPLTAPLLRRTASLGEEAAYLLRIAEAYRYARLGHAPGVQERRHRAPNAEVSNGAPVSE